MAVATKRSPITLATLNVLAGLANGKGIYGRPYSFTGPAFAVGSDAEMQRINVHAEETYAVRTDNMTVYRKSGAGGWASTELQVYENATPSGGGTAGNLIFVLATQGHVTKYVWRDSGVDQRGIVRFNSGWYPANMRGVLEAMRSAVFASWAGRQTNIKNEVFVFGSGNDPEVALAWRGEVSAINVNPFGAVRQERLRAFSELGNISFITAAENVTVETQAPGFANIFRQAIVTGADVSGDRFKARCKFRLRDQGVHSGRLTGTGRIGGPPPGAEYTVTGLTVGHSTRIERLFNGAERLVIEIDGGWSGTEVDFTVTATWDNPQPTQFLDNGIVELTFRIAGQPPVASINAFGGDGFESVAIGCPNALAATEAEREGPMIQEGYAGPEPIGEGELLFEDGWRDTGGTSFVGTSRAVSGIWRAIPYGALPGAGTDPRASIPPRSYFAPFTGDPVESNDGNVAVVTAVDGIIPRYPVLKTTDVPNRKMIQIVLPGSTPITFPGTGSIYSLSVHRVKETIGPLSVKVGYVNDAGAFQSKATLSIAAGARDSETIYPGWWVLPNKGVTMAYQCTEPVNVQALWVRQQRFTHGPILPDASSARLTDDCAVFAFLFNDMESMLNALP